MEEIVHWCDFASQPNIHIACRLQRHSSWTTPAWGDSTQKEEPFRADNGKLYAFSATIVTCVLCKRVVALYNDGAESDSDKVEE